MITQITAPTYEIQCDSCGVTEKYSDARPPNWTDIAISNMTVKNICPNCKQLPFSELEAKWQK